MNNINFLAEIDRLRDEKQGLIQALEEVIEMCISHEKAEKIVMANEIITKINEVLKSENHKSADS